MSLRCDRAQPWAFLEVAQGGESFPSILPKRCRAKMREYKAYTCATASQNESYVKFCLIFFLLLLSLSFSRCQVKPI
jgi:hypothetical protein